VVVIAHISDTHLDGSPDRFERVKAVMDYLNALPHDLDAVLVTGDVADHGLPEEYEQAREVLTSRHPLLVCPGNHDARSAFREVLRKEPAADAPVNQVFRTAAAMFALCDSSVPGRDDGRLSAKTLAWLTEQLEVTPSEIPAFVAFHHPPVSLQAGLIDAIRPSDGDRLAKLITRYPNVVAILCGHAHSPAATTFADRPLLVAPGVVSTLRMPWEYTGVGWHLDYDMPPAVAFHVLDDLGRLTTHYRLTA
jgi:3',5'-cyclic AMP phosphodiesterase CpdA